MTIAEWWWLYEVQKLKNDAESGASGTPTEAEWDAARAEHAAKMKARHEQSNR